MSETGVSAHRDKPVVLIANDQEWTARAVESILDVSGYRVVRAHTAVAAEAAAFASDPDLVILDLQLPDFSGIDLCRRLRDNPRFGTALPIIITTAGPSGRQQRLKAYEAGAWEFYGQPLDAEALLHKLAVYSAVSGKVRGLRRQQTFDTSTGCYTALGMRHRLTEMVADARRHGRTLACIAWRGRDVSPDAVADAAREVVRSARSADVVGRLPDNEIVLASSDLSRTGAEALVARMHQVLVRVLQVSGDQIASTILVTRTASAPDDADQLLTQLRGAVAA